MRDQKKIQAEIEGLKRDGKILPEDVVRFAENPETALHDCFEWDDTAAAHQHRLAQARQVLRVYVTVESPDSKEPVRALVALRSDLIDGGGYRPIADIMGEDAMRIQLMKQALSDLNTARNRYARLTELCGVFQELDKAQEKFDLQQGMANAG